MVGVMRGVTAMVTVGVTRAVTEVVATVGAMRAVTDVVVTVGVARVTDVVVTVGVARVTDVVVTVVRTAVAPTLVVVRPTAVFATLVLATVPRPTMLPDVVATAAPLPAIVAVEPTALPTTFGLMRAVMFGVRVPTFRLGERMMLCASAAPDNSSTKQAAISAAAAPSVVFRRLSLCGFNRLSLSRSCRQHLLRRRRQIDDFFVLQPGDQHGRFLLRHRLVAELQAEHAPRRAVDDGCLVGVQKRRNVGDARVRGKPDKGPGQRVRGRGLARRGK